MLVFWSLFLSYSVVVTLESLFLFSSCLSFGVCFCLIALLLRWRSRSYPYDVVGIHSVTSRQKEDGAQWCRRLFLIQPYQTMKTG
jgi:hypothetical protein